VEKWAREEKRTAIHGPLGFTNMDHTGLLIDGFDELATMAAGYNYPYYQDHMEQAGYSKDVDTVDYQMTMSDGINPKIEKLAGIVQKRFGLRLLEVKNKKELIPYAHELFDLLGEEYQHLYAVVPLTEAQVDAYIDQYFGFISPEFVPVVVDENDKMVAFGITIPSLAKALQKAKGRLFPFGFLHLMRAMKKNDTAELMLVAVAKEYQGKGVNALLITHIFKVFQDFGIRIAESNPELENNLAVQAQWKHFNRRQHKLRRIYIKHL
jgi:GNAT superfamily N-acetyltransferase